MLDEDASRLRRRRRAALATCAAVALGMPIAFIRWGRDPEALYTVIAIAMVAGTLLVGLAAVALRCPRCGYDFVKEVFGGLDLRTKRMNRTIVALARPLRCPSCDLSEDDRGSERWGA